MKYKFCVPLKFGRSPCVIYPVVLLTLFVYNGCNFFNPSGQVPEDVGNSANDFLVLGQMYLDRQEFSAARSAFEEAFERDSSLSEAYLGAAQAVLQQYQIKITDVVHMINGVQDTLLTVLHTDTSITDTQFIPFVFFDITSFRKDELFQGNRAAHQYLIRLTRPHNGIVSDKEFIFDFVLAGALYASLKLADYDGNQQIDSVDKTVTQSYSVLNQKDIRFVVAKDSSYAFNSNRFQNLADSALTILMTVEPFSLILDSIFNEDKADSTQNIKTIQSLVKQIQILKTSLKKIAKAEEPLIILNYKTN